jgi:hypothetical protein
MEMASGGVHTQGWRFRGANAGEDDFSDDLLDLGAADSVCGHGTGKGYGKRFTGKDRIGRG